jgi:hypothetical protein
MEELSWGFWLTLLMLPFGGGIGDNPDDLPTFTPMSTAPSLHYAIEYADTDELVRGIEEGFGNYGISRNDTLV